ncbi:MAG: nitrate- and nitrite sensing domain-containing protein [Microthrixaceae bacterium]
MRRATHIRTKLGLALAVPLVAVIVMAGFEVSTAVGAVDGARSSSALTAVANRSSALISSLQTERSLAVLDLAGFNAPADAGSSGEARASVDAAANELRAVLTARGESVGPASAAAIDALKGLDAVRADVDAAASVPGPDRADEVYDAYASVIDALMGSSTSVEQGVEDGVVRTGVGIVAATTEQIELRARMAWTAAVAAAAGDAEDPTVGRVVASLQDRSRMLAEEIRTSVAGTFPGIADGPGPDAFDDAVDAFLNGRATSTDALLTGMTLEGTSGYRGIRDEVASTLAERAGRLEREAMTRQWVFGGIGLALFLLAPLVTWLAIRSITRPLASLRHQAEDMARTRLPAAVRQILDTPFGDDVVIPRLEPIDVGSRDEVAEVAAALDAVQTSALDLAVEQAVLRRNISDSYINLGRRNQNLLGRQLDFITELERNESDPDTLEGLFRLDHLATRMRRNAESLLVLAGVEAPRQWAAPVKVSDVVRAALGEVEDYQRVVIRHLEPAALTGAVASDIAHITAELVENALSFSPPDQQVEVKGRLTLEGYTIAISDNGFGMPPADRERANGRLAGTESFTVAPSRYLGHYVAGHLASRLGIVVELQDSPAGGITARMDVPMGLIANEETDPQLNKARPAPSEPDVVTTSVEPTAPEDVVADTPVPDEALDPIPAASFTASGLARRGDRASVAPDAAPADAVLADAVVQDAVAQDAVALDAVAVEPETAVAASEPVAPVAPVAAVGFGGLAMTGPTGPSLFTVAARNARLGNAPTKPDDTTLTGLVRRVPGAQRPDVPIGASRAVEEPWATGERAATPTSAEDVYSFLSTFQSGVERGRVEGHTPEAEPFDMDVTTMEEGR